jgi:hypothetical protein
MTKRTKVVILIVSQTLIIAFGYMLEAFFGKSVEIDWKNFVSILLNWLFYIAFGFLVENAKKLFIYSSIIALVNTIFVCSDMYFNMNDYQETLLTFGDSAFVFISFGFIFEFILCVIFFSFGMFLSYLYKVVFKKQADKF